MLWLTLYNLPKHRPGWSAISPLSCDQTWQTDLTVKKVKHVWSSLITHYWVTIQYNETWTSKWNPYRLIWRELTKYIMRDAHFFHSMHHGYKGLDFEFFCSFIIFILNKAKFHSHFCISGAEALEAISWKFSLVQSFSNHLPFNLNRTRSFGFCFFCKLEFSLS